MRLTPNADLEEQRLFEDFLHRLLLYLSTDDLSAMLGHFAALFMVMVETTTA